MKTYFLQDILVVGMDTFGCTYVMSLEGISCHAGLYTKLTKEISWWWLSGRWESTRENIIKCLACFVALFLPTELPSTGLNWEILYQAII